MKITLKSILLMLALSSSLLLAQFAGGANVKNKGENIFEKNLVVA